MKKVLFIVFACLFAAGLVAAKEAPKQAKNDAAKPAPKGEMMPGRAEMLKDFKEMKALVATYKAAKTDKEKAAAEAAIKQKVADNYDRHLSFMEERLAKSQKKLAEIEQRIKDSKKADVKAKKIDEITKRIVSGERPAVFAPPPDGKDGPASGKGDKRHFMNGGPRGPMADMEGEDDGMPMPPPPPPPFDEEPSEDLPEAV